MKKQKKSIYKRTKFFYKGALIVKASWVVNFMSKIGNVEKKHSLVATVFLPFIVFVSKTRDCTHDLCRHEVIHTRQIADCMMTFFVLGLYLDFGLMITIFFSFLGLFAWWGLYSLEFFILKMFFSHHEAYLLISHEQEAYLNERKEKYLKIRILMPFPWLYFLLRNIILLPFHKKREKLISRLKMIRAKRKAYSLWVLKYNKKNQSA